MSWGSTWTRCQTPFRYSIKYTLAPLGAPFLMIGTTAHLTSSEPFPFAQAAVVSSIACTIGSAIPLLAGAFVFDANARIAAVVVATAFGCLLFGVTASALGGAGLVKGGLRVLIGGCLSMGITYGIGYGFGTTVG